MKRFFILIMFILILSTLFSFEKEAIEYYQAGLNAYQQSNYEKALYYFEKALVIDPSIEGYDTSLKFKAGISAYMIGNYEKAKAYLSGYTENPFVKELLNDILKNSTSTSEEWSNWIEKYKPMELPASTETTNKKNNSKLILFLITFLSSFAILLIMELRVIKAKKTYPQPLETTKEVEQQLTTKTSGIIFNENEELIPENSYTMDFNELINKELSFLSELFEGLEEIESNNEEEIKSDIEDNVENSHPEIIAEKENKEEENVDIDEVIEEIDELEEMVSDQDEKLIKSEVEQSLIEKIKSLEISSSEESSGELPIEIAEEFSSLNIEEAFSKFDEKEELEEGELKLITEKLKEFISTQNQKEEEEII
ncbi:tetratricopeptide (TPR) repeat protein [Thermosipho japonicus]|uniref:Tetratricopeptide (TPR) repeat protein n=1 Tax=Thermosipho japonicus TaxID=90323 RepID=A0A841GQ54_9BACT|nr:tetratricopeptide repeat protein [Thermosipho japonicus]MBB6061719.1 tetratricopeptide (TPR) repeat protein [Thermosipho japonicus]